MSQKTWTDLFGSFNSDIHLVDGTYIVERVPSSCFNFKVLWDCETHDIAVRCFEAWKNDSAD